MMVRWTLTDLDSATELRNRLNLYNIEEVLTWDSLRWFGHLQRMDVSTWPRKALDKQVARRNQVVFSNNILSTTTLRSFLMVYPRDLF